MSNYYKRLKLPLKLHNQIRSGSLCSTHLPFLGKMTTFLIRILLPLLVITMTIPLPSEAESEQWCIVDEQTPDHELQEALDWVCGEGGADCSKMQQAEQPCFFPNTTRDHASYTFNSYYQTYKSKGGSCYFNGATMITELDPSHDSCRYEYNP